MNISWNICPNVINDKPNESLSHAQTELLIFLEWLLKLTKWKIKTTSFCHGKQRNAYHCSNPWLETQLCYKLYIWCSWTWTSCFLLRISSKLFFWLFLEKCCFWENPNNIWVWKKSKTALFLLETYLVIVYDMWEALWLCSGLKIQSQSKVLVCYS